MFFGGIQLTKIRKLLDRQVNLHERDPEEQNGEGGTKPVCPPRRRCWIEAGAEPHSPRAGEDGDVRVTVRRRGRAILRVLDRRCEPRWRRGEAGQCHPYGELGRPPRPQTKSAKPSAVCPPAVCERR